MYPPEIILKHYKSNGVSILPQALPQIASLISEWQSTGLLCRLSEPRNKELKLTEDGVREHLAWLNDKARSGTDKAFILLSSDRKSSVSLAINCSPFSEIEKIRLLIHPRFSKETLQSHKIVELVGQMGDLFEAYTGYLVDLSLAQFINQNEDFNMPMRHFDTRQVPYGLWWVNYWSKNQVETVGKQRAKEASWYLFNELSNGSIVTLITEEITDINNPEHQIKLRNLLGFLNLRSFQELHHLSEPIMDTPG